MVDVGGPRDDFPERARRPAFRFQLQLCVNPVTEGYATRGQSSSLQHSKR